MPPDMKASIRYEQQEYQVDLTDPLDVSIPLQHGASNLNAWYAAPPKIAPHSTEGFVGSVAKGGAVNFNDIWFNPHAHVTHTECSGHITAEVHSVNKRLDRFFFFAEVITIAPEKFQKDFVISKKQLEYALRDKNPEALLIRTLPNTVSKKKRQYSNTNPPYLLAEGVQFLVDRNISHLLVDLPSVDKEKDKGALSAHKTFWHLDGEIRENATITEFIFVPNTILDGTYFLNIQIAPMENDASPSRPVLYKIV